jgi:hypothetical protein
MSECSFDYDPWKPPSTTIQGNATAQSGDAARGCGIAHQPSIDREHNCRLTRTHSKRTGAGQDAGGKNTSVRTSMLSRGGAAGASGFSNEV